MFGHSAGVGEKDSDFSTRILTLCFGKRYHGWSGTIPSVNSTTQININLYISDSSESLPGFTLILLTLDRVNSHVASTCVNINGAFCISSSRYRDKTCEFQTFRPHGPCTSGRIGSTDIDHAHCLVSDFWPPIACSWINRCNLWPAPHVVDQIVKSGCHVVAIGHKLSKHVENEWRISFSKQRLNLCTV